MAVWPAPRLKYYLAACGGDSLYRDLRHNGIPSEMGIIAAGAIPRWRNKRILGLSIDRGSFAGRMELVLVTPASLRIWRRGTGSCSI